MRPLSSRWAIVALDQGSSRSRAVLFDLKGKPLARAEAPLRTDTPKPGWVEHDPEEMLEGVRTVLRKVLREARRLERVPIALGIANALLIAGPALRGIANTPPHVLLPQRARAAAILSIAIWLCVAASGRLIAYF